MRHSSKTINEIKQLRIKGYTLTEIVSKTGLSKSTILGYIENIPKSKFLVEKIRMNRLRGQKIVALGRKGKSLKTYSFIKPKKWDCEFVNLVAHFLFDGRISYSSCIYFNRSDELVFEIEQKMKNILGITDCKRYVTSEGVKRVACHNVEVASFVKEKANKIFAYITSAPIEHKISFLKAFFDDEGSVRFRNKTRIVRGYQHSVRILEIVSKLLQDIGIDSMIDKRFYEINIYRKQNIEKFAELINFTPGLRVNGKRSNSIWKKDLEKRKILQMAIDSYL